MGDERGVTSFKVEAVDSGMKCYNTTKKKYYPVLIEFLEDRLQLGSLEN